MWRDPVRPSVGQSLSQLFQEEERSFSKALHSPASPRPPHPLLALKRHLFLPGVFAGPSATPANETVWGCPDKLREQ